MKKALKISVLIIGIALILLLMLILFFILITKDSKIDESKFNDSNLNVVYYDINEHEVYKENNGISYTKSDDIPTHVKNAFISIEDKRFYHHNGIDKKGIIRATLNNIKSLKAKEGASTITQQLIKNTHLTNVKTLSRKLNEIKLSLLAEKKYSKDEILEKYLNTIYFGNGCYGITSASNYYFNKKPSELSINEGALLAGIIKAPNYYSITNNFNASIKRKNVVLTEMLNNNYITEEQYNYNLNKDVILNINEAKKYDYFYLVREELNKIIDKNPYLTKKINVYTNYNPLIQEKIQIENTDEFSNSRIVINKENKVLAFSSNIGNIKRQIGSTIKPLLVYGPAIEENVVYSCSKISDEKINYNGYSPSNYNNKYYGKISVKEALATSSNTVAVKLLSYTKINNSIKYLNKTAIKLTEKDNNLAIALGGTTNGYTLQELASSYQVFVNNGNFNQSYTINKITNSKNNLIYKKNIDIERVFSSGTISILNDMLRETVSKGTAKKLNTINFPIYSKTGTVGNSKGNSDCYSISYTEDYILGVWYGSKENQYLSNTITGGTLPTSVAKDIWLSIYQNNYPNELKKENIEEIEIDLLKYQNDGKIEIAEEIAPKRYKLKCLFKIDNKPTIKSNTFIYPNIEMPIISVNNNGINMQLCVPQCINVIVFKIENGIKKEVYDTFNNNKTSFNDENLIIGNEYQYVFIPYYKYNDDVYYGKEIKSSKFIYQPTSDNWWIDN